MSMLGGYAETPEEMEFASRRDQAYAEAQRDYQELCEAISQKNAAYEERNRVVALLAAMAADMGWLVIRTKTAIEGWSKDWHGCIYIETPKGQVSWHYHDSHAHLFAHVPERASWEWDGHDTPTKYRRIAELSAQSKKERP